MSVAVDSQTEHVEPGAVLPGSIKVLLEDRLGEQAEPTAFALADVAPSGQFGQAWAVLSDGHLAIADLNRTDGPELRLTPLESDVELEILEGVGSSRFRVVRDGKLAEELRFSQRQAKRFSQLLRRGQTHIRGQEQGEQPGSPGGPEQEEKFCDKCGRLIPDWAEACPRCLQKRRILWRLLSFAWPYKRWLIIGMGSALAVTLLQLVPPKLTQFLIDYVLQEPKPGPPPERDLLWTLIGALGGKQGSAHRPDLLWPLIAGLGCIVVLRVGFQYLRLNRLARLSELMTHDLRTGRWVCGRRSGRIVRALPGSGARTTRR